MKLVLIRIQASFTYWDIFGGGIVDQVVRVLENLDGSDRKG